MSPKRHGGYSYSLDESVTRSAKRKKQSRFLSVLLWLLLLTVVGAAGLFVLYPGLLSTAPSYLPFPK